MSDDDFRYIVVLLLVGIVLLVIGGVVTLAGGIDDICAKLGGCS